MKVDFIDINKYSFLKDNLQSYISNEIRLDKTILDKYKKDKFKKREKIDNRNSYQRKKPINNVYNDTKVDINSLNDTLFWCFFIIQNNYSQFEFLNNKNIAFENQLKINLITEIRGKREMLKNYKIPITRIESSLMEKKISIQTLLYLCKIYNFNICYINDRVFNCHIIDENKEVPMISLKKNEYSYDLISYEEYSNRINDLYEIENLEKPLKSITSYKLDELKQIYNKLNLNPINSSEKITKSKLYEEIYKYF
jgi:hypothetical protein